MAARLLKYETVAAMLEMSVRQVRALCDLGKLKRHKENRRCVRVTAKSVEQYILAAENAKEPRNGNPAK